MMSDDDIVLPTPWALEAAYMSKARDEEKERLAQLAADAARWRKISPLLEWRSEGHGFAWSLMTNAVFNGTVQFQPPSIDAAIDSLPDAPADAIDSLPESESEG